MVHTCRWTVIIQKINISSTQFELKLSNYNLSQRANNKVTVLRVSFVCRGIVGALKFGIFDS